ncbi:MAG: hypothetical protein VX583_12175 [Bdellovibrionota bacterium]
MDTIVNVFRDLMYGLVKVFFITCVASVICFAQDEKDKAIELLSLYQKISQANTRSDLVPDGEVSSSIEKSLKKIMLRVHPDRVYRNFQVDDLPAYLEEVRSNSRLQKTLPKITKEFISDVAAKVISLKDNGFEYSSDSNGTSKESAFFYFKDFCIERFAQVYSGRKIYFSGLNEEESKYFERIDLKAIYQRFNENDLIVNLEEVGNSLNHLELFKYEIFKSSLILAMYSIVLDLDLEMEKRLEIEGRFLKNIKKVLAENSSLLPIFKKNESNSESPSSLSSRTLRAMGLVSNYMLEASFTPEFQKNLKQYVSFNGRWLSFHANYFESPEGLFRLFIIPLAAVLSAYIFPELARAHPYIYGSTAIAFFTFVVHRFASVPHFSRMLGKFKGHYPKYSEASEAGQFCRKSAKRLN